MNIYIIGFPKSGNTFLRLILTQILDANTLDNEKTIDLLKLNINKNSNINIYAPHSAKLKNEKYIYIVRNPIDTLKSGIFFNNSSLTKDKVINNFFYKLYFRYEFRSLINDWQGNPFQRSLKFFFNLFKIKNGIIDLNIGSWIDHIDRFANSEKALVVKYEDLISNTKFYILKILKHLDVYDEIKHNDVFLNKIININRKKKLKKLAIESSLNNKFQVDFDMNLLIKTVGKKNINLMKKKFKRGLARFDYNF